MTTLDHFCRNRAQNDHFWTTSAWNRARMTTSGPPFAWNRARMTTFGLLLPGIGPESSLLDHLLPGIGPESSLSDGVKLESGQNRARKPRIVTFCRNRAEEAQNRHFLTESDLGSLREAWSRAQERPAPWLHSRTASWPSVRLLHQGTSSSSIR